jgi:glycerate 2-kinase
VTVRVPAGAAGKGGRNQHFALLCSELIAGSEITVLSAGSDGIDGNSPAAGGLVDDMTVARAEVEKYPVAAALAAFDAHSLLVLLGDSVTTGPTGNNLRDLRILLAP